MILDEITDSVRIPESIGVQGIVSGWKIEGLDEKTDLSDLLAQIRQLPEYADAPKHVLMDALRRNVLNRRMASAVKLTKVFEGHNLVVNKFFEHLFARLQGTPTSDQTLAVGYFAIGTNYGTSPASTDTTLVNEIFRFVPSELYNNGTLTFYASTLIKSSQGNPTGNTTVSNATTPTTSQFSVANAASLLSGDLVEVQTSLGNYDCRITNVNGSIITVFTLDTIDNLLPTAPAVGYNVARMYGEGGLFMGTLATNVANSGALVNRKLFRYKKTNAAGILIDVALSFLPTGT
jgi:hypothetical protein